MNHETTPPISRPIWSTYPIITKKSYLIAKSQQKNYCPVLNPMLIALQAFVIYCNLPIIKYTFT